MKFSINKYSYIYFLALILILLIAPLVNLRSWWAEDQALHERCGKLSRQSAIERTQRIAEVLLPSEQTLYFKTESRDAQVRYGKEHPKWFVWYGREPNQFPLEVALNADTGHIESIRTFSNRALPYPLKECLPPNAAIRKAKEWITELDLIGQWKSVGPAKVNGADYVIPMTDSTRQVTVTILASHGSLISVQIKYNQARH